MSTNMHVSIALHSSWRSFKLTGTCGSHYIPEYSPSRSGFRGLKRSWQNHSRQQLVPRCWLSFCDTILFCSAAVPGRFCSFPKKILNWKDNWYSRHTCFLPANKKKVQPYSWRTLIFLCVFCNSAFSKMTSALWVTTNSGGRIWKRK